MAERAHERITDQDRLEEILEVLLNYTLLNFEPQINVGLEGDHMDAIAAGVNTLGEELDDSLKKIQQKEKELIRKNKELEQITHITSHDLQEPLRTILNFTDLLNQRYGGKIDPEFDQFLKFISEGTLRMSQLVRGLLDYGLVGLTKEKEPIDLNGLLEDVLMDMAAHISFAKATVNFDNLPTIVGFRTEMRLLFQNLISNALKFVDEGVNPKVEITADVVGNYWEIRVADNGIGISEKQVHKIFKIFNRLHPKNKYEGIGIGLAHCKKIIDLHNGEIFVEQGKEGGSVFVCRFLK